MTQTPFSSDELNGASPEFPPTSWSLIGRAGDQHTRVAADALETLCRAYWYPLYAFARRSGNAPHDAQDWVQSFFEYLLAHRVVGKADSGRGRFRSFLLGTFKHFMSTERRRQSAQKRGGAHTFISLDEDATELRYRSEPVAAHTPETLFELSWARTVLARVATKLEQEYAAAGKREAFKLLQPHLQSGRQNSSLAETAKAFGKSEDAVKSAVMRLRQRFQQLLREQITETVSTTEEVEQELQHLRQVLG